MEISFAVALCLILAAILSSELKISSAVLEILAGITLVLLIPDIAHANWLEFLSHLGMLALMFVAGFELELERLRKKWRASTVIGVSSFTIPLIGLYLILRHILHMDHTVAALMSIGLSTTSLALVYHALKEHGLLSTTEGQKIFGAASVVDVLSMVALALLLGNAGWGTAIFVVFYVISVFSLPHFGAWIFKRYPNSMAEPELRFLMVILVAMGFMAESVGSIHPAIVAFTLGMVMTGLLEKNEEVKDKLMSLVFSFFAPIFFLHAGTRIDVSGLSIEYILLGLFIFMIVIGLKYVGTYLPARRYLPDRPRFTALLFNYNLSFGIITANVGLEAGILSQQLYSVIMMIVIASAALPAILLRKI